MTNLPRSLVRRGWPAAVATVAAVIAGCASSGEPEPAPTHDPSFAQNALAALPVRSASRGPDGKGGGTSSSPPESAGATTNGVNGIDYHGGPIIRGTTDIYYIWYGSWGGNTATSILTDLASTIGGSPYFNINTTYTDGTVAVSNSVTYSGSTTDAYSQGTSLSDAQIAAVVSSALTSGRLPTDANGVYFVLTSSDVTASSGFCTEYCGWHNHATMHGADIKYAFVGNPDNCNGVCKAQSNGPNGNAGADAMASVIAHELEETVTDPDISAWWVSTTGNENADQCAWTFGAEFTAPNGARANMTLGARSFLIQQNWVNAGGGSCAISYQTPACAPGANRFCCAFAGCACLGTQTCAADGTWARCAGSVPRGHRCPGSVTAP